MRVTLEDLFDDVTDIAMPHVRLAERLLADLGELADGIADHRVAEVELPLIAIGERSGPEVDRRQRQRLVVQAGEVLAEQTRLLQLAAGRANRLARPGECLHGASLEG